jgi:hypothetical protein
MINYTYLNPQVPQMGMYPNPNIGMNYPTYGYSPNKVNTGTYFPYQMYTTPGYTGMTPFQQTTLKPGGVQPLSGTNILPTTTASTSTTTTSGSTTTQTTTTSVTNIPATTGTEFKKTFNKDAPAYYPKGMRVIILYIIFRIPQWFPQ